MSFIFKIWNINQNIKNIYNSTLIISIKTVEIKMQKMKTIKFVVTNIVSKPILKMLWCVDVVAECENKEEEITLTFLTEEDAKTIGIGYEFNRVIFK